jgi:hypothetical protein
MRDPCRREHAQSSDIPACRKQRIGFLFQRAAYRPDAVPGHQPATATRLPHAAGALQNAGEVLWAADRHHAPEIGELDRADAGVSMAA